MKIDPLVLESIKRMHLPTIIERYGIPLQKNGWFNRKSSCRIACPFHEDKTPSLSVSEKNGKWVWNCFGCREHGNTFDFLMKMDKSDFEGTYRKYADVREINTVPSTSIPTPPPPLPPPADPHTNDENGHLPTVNRADLLMRVVDQYHQAFLEDRSGADYLAGRGIKDPVVFTTFKIGLANGSLRDILPKDPAHELIVSLKTLGVLNEKGNEHFTNCVVFPIYDERGAVTGLYGRRISSNASKSAQTPSAPGLPDHLYLPGPRRGVWNGGAAKVYKDLVVTESIIDALSLYSVGIKNVIPLYGTNGLTEGHSALFLERQTRRVFLCLDNDAAGERARPGVKEKLESLGIEVLNYDLPKMFKDPNEALVKGFPEEQLLALARMKSVASDEEKTPSHVVSDGKSGDAKQTSPTVERKEEAIFLRFPSRLYRVRGLSAKNLDQLRVNIKVESCGEGSSGGYHLDSLDLYSAKSRATFVACVRKVIEANEGDLLKELNQIIEALELIQVDTVEGKKEEETPRTAEESEAAMAALRRPTLLPEILQDLDAIGYVGEEKNKAIGYLVGVSRKLLDPLSCVIISQSAAGKSVLADIIERVTPPEDVKLYSRVTANGLFYFKRDELKRKLLILEERAGAESADYSIRTLQSKKKLVQAVPVKNPDTGKIQTVTFEVEGPIAYIETTTKSRIHDENATRCFEIYLDESKEQTQRIHFRQRQSKTLSGLNKKGGQDTLLRRHHNMQRLLRTIAVVIPYAELLEFPTEWLRTRRDNLRFLNLIEVIAFLHQHQREVKKTADGGEYIEATLDDYKTAYSLAREVMGESFLELKKPQRQLLDQIETLLSKNGDEVTRREIRDHTGLTDFRLRDLLGELVSLEYIVETVSGQGRTCRYRLADRSVRPEKIVVGLTAPDALAEKMKQNGLLP